MSHSSPKITVLTPLFNRESFIAETLSSILEQDYKNFELIIIDDGSTDNSKKVIKPFLKNKKIKYIYQNNMGEAETVNKGWSLAKGEYFTQINSDDPIKPGLFREMTQALDNNKEAVVAYPDFQIINEINNPDWNFAEAFSAFSCYAASPGAFIRKSAFSNWKKLKDSRFLYTNDVFMYWQMALEGNFIHIPRCLATWRSHSDAISANRYQSIPEIEIWIEEYFNKKNLPNKILNYKSKIKKAIYEYFIHLLKNSNANKKTKNTKISEYKEKLNNIKFDFKNLQIGDNDLIGNVFNGHNLHLYLREANIDSSHLVWNKESFDENTHMIALHRTNRQELNLTIQDIQKEYNLNGILNPLTYDILYNKLFLEADVVHYHLINNINFDLQLLPILTRLKPSIWTIHDEWSLTGRCIKDFGCDKWKTGCGDCPYLDTPYPMKKDNTALNFEIKKLAIQNSKLDIIVASKSIMKKVKASLMFCNAKIHLIPFGIDQEIFKPLDKYSIREKLSIPKDAFVLSFRSDDASIKGREYINHALKKIKTKKEIIILTLGYEGNKIVQKYRQIDFGWIKNEKLLAEIYSASDLFLMPSLMEAFELMAVEAMSCGILPIVLEGTALPDTVNSPDCGIAVPRDKKKYAETVQYYIDNDKEREIRANKCLIFAKKIYNKDLYISKIIEIYKETMSRHSLDPDAKRILQQLKNHMTVDNRPNIINTTKFQKNIQCETKNEVIIKNVNDTSFNPLVSIIIPVYNGENYVKEAIDSALAQTYKNIEIITVNDGSTDKTEEILKSYGSKIKYFTKENGGVATALNLAIEKSKGEYISWLSHDDVYLKTKIQINIEKLSNIDSTRRYKTILYSNYMTIDKNSNTIAESRYHQLHTIEKLNSPFYPLFNGLIHGCSLLIPKKCFFEIGKFNPRLKHTQDYDLWYRMFPEYHIQFIDKITIKSRIHDKQNSKKYDTSKECDELWIDMINNVNEEQINFMYGEVLPFYKGVLKITSNAGYSATTKYVKKKLYEYEKMNDLYIKKNKIKAWLRRIIRRILLYTPGFRKMQILEDLIFDNKNKIIEVSQKINQFISIEQENHLKLEKKVDEKMELQIKKLELLFNKFKNEVEISSINKNINDHRDKARDNKTGTRHPGTG